MIPPAAHGWTTHAHRLALGKRPTDRRRDSHGQASERFANGEAILSRFDAQRGCVVSVERDDRDRRPPTGPTLAVDHEARRARSYEPPDRYEELRLLGTGGHGEVRRMFDRQLERVVAMKTLRLGADASRALAARFLTEIKVTAALSHPGVVAVFDYGTLSDGQLWFTMPEVRGSTLRARIDACLADATRDASAHRALLECFSRVCETMAYAHRRGVIHRDLKPENIMIGEFGETLVMDWGLARNVADRTRESRAETEHHRADPERAHTRDGTILGTPSYMAPEQACGDIDAHGPPTDVFALGAILRQLLAAGANAHLFAEDLERIADRATMHEPTDRFGDATELSQAVRAALDGSLRRERAAAALVEAAALTEQINGIAREIDALRASASRRLAAISPDAATTEKEPAWLEQDRAAERESERAVLEARWLQSVHGALQLDPTFRDAHLALAKHYADELLRAEHGRRAPDATRFEELLRAHDPGEYTAILRGLAKLTLVTDPPGARVMARKYEPRGRRLELSQQATLLGVTPIDGATLAHGSYLLTIQLDGYETTRYPIVLARGEHWDGCAPNERSPRAIALPREGELDDDEVYVPAGYAWTGGDPLAIESLPLRRVWIDGFVAGRFPVTNAEYIAFLDDLVARGLEAEALAACPRSNRGVGASPPDALSFERRRDGTFRLRDDDPGEVWRPRGPVVLVTWNGAQSYARWRAARTGRGDRLLHELEREKAVRSVDGRCFSWGDHFEPTWTRVASSTRAEASRVDVDDYPVDASPYGLRQGVGNTRDFCLNAWTIDGPALDGAVLRVRGAELPSEYRSVRGGAWSSVEHHCRAASRFANRIDDRRSTIGIRVGRPFR